MKAPKDRFDYFWTIYRVDFDIKRSLEDVIRDLNKIKEEAESMGWKDLRIVEQENDDFFMTRSINIEGYKPIFLENHE